MALSCRTSTKDVLFTLIIAVLVLRDVYTNLLVLNQCTQIDVWSPTAPHHRHRGDTLLHGTRSGSSSGTTKRSGAVGSSSPSSSNGKNHRLLEANVCHQNPYRDEFKHPIETMAKRSQDWLDRLPDHRRRADDKATMWQRDHRRYFVFQEMSKCKKLTCLGGPCSIDQSKKVCGFDQLKASKKKKKKSALSRIVSKPPPCVVYSIGGNNQWKFENDVLNQTDCEIHTFDCTGPADRFTKKPPNVNFHHVCIGTEHEDAPAVCDMNGLNKCGETWTLQEIQQKFGHRRIDLFKMDVEGYEWPIFRSWRELGAPGADQVVLPMQVLVEIHFGGKTGRHEPPEVVDLAEHLTRIGYSVLIRDDNPYCPYCTELTLIRTSCPQTGVYQSLLST